MKKHGLTMKGFTLIEILIVIGIIAILAAVVIIAVNPGKQFADANNASRHAEINTISNAIVQYQVDQRGVLPSTITTTETEICETNAASCTGLIDLSVLTASALYLPEIPNDPLCPGVCGTNGVGYTVWKTGNNRVCVNAPDAELAQTIQICR